MNKICIGVFVMAEIEEGRNKKKRGKKLILK
jgi:hypothetical protein